jgi:hypothetical protein
VIVRRGGLRLDVQAKFRKNGDYYFVSLKIPEYVSYIEGPPEFIERPDGWYVEVTDGNGMASIGPITEEAVRRLEGRGEEAWHVAYRRQTAARLNSSHAPHSTRYS